ncbi:MAG: hypothetical protein CL610_21415 [Anaerolineaceae bacterium]|nr:hypothetical protein [Anaerolineaceae bacterium]
MMSTIVVKPVENREEYFAARELAAHIFSRGNLPDEAARMDRANRYLSLPGFAFDWHRIALKGDQVAAHVVALPLRLRYGSVELRVGGLGAVCTDPAWRKQGLAAAVLQDAIHYMQARGDHISLLDGIPGFYHQFGYHTVWPGSSLEFSAEAAAALDAPLQSRPASIADAQAMGDLYDRCWGHRVAIVRSHALWHWRLETMPLPSMRVIEDRTGCMVGYYVGADEVLEVVAETEAAALTAIAEIGRAYLAHNRETVSLVVPPDDRLVFTARRWLTTTLHTRYVPNGHWMGRIVDPVGLRDIMLPEMMQRAGLDGRGLIFDIQPDAVHIGLRGQDSTNVQIEPGDFLRLMFGTLPASQLDFHADATHLLERLFPPRTAMIAPWDWF